MLLQGGSPKTWGACFLTRSFQRTSHVWRETLFSPAVCRPPPSPAPAPALPVLWKRPVPPGRREQPGHKEQRERQVLKEQPAFKGRLDHRDLWGTQDLKGHRVRKAQRD